MARKRPSRHVRGILETNKRRGWVKTRVKMQKGRCALCGQPLDGDATADHHIPLGRGGTDSFDNIQATHSACNAKKGNRLPEEIGNLFA